MATLRTLIQYGATGTLMPRLFVVGVVVLAIALVAHRKGFSRLAVVLNAILVAGAVLSVFAVQPRPLATQPFPDAHELADSTRQWASGNGYVTYVHGGRRQRPMYPPGFPLALAPFALAGDDYPANVQRGATFYAAVYVLAAAIAAWSLQGSPAAAIVALLMSISPFPRVAASLVLTDAFAVALTLFVLALLVRPTSTRISIAAFLAGALVAIRLPAAINLIALFLVLPRSSWKRLLAFSAPPLAALAIFNWQAFGSPLTTGYHQQVSVSKMFAAEFALRSPMPGDGPWIIRDALDGLLLQRVCPCPFGGPQAAMSNLAYYSAILASLFWLFLPPLFPLLGMVYLWRNRRTAAAQFSAAMMVLSLLLFIFYNYQGARFMAAPVTLLGVLAAAQIGGWICNADSRR
jgi:hypothetical protein